MYLFDIHIDFGGSIYFIGLFSIELVQFFIYSGHKSFFATLPGNISGCDLYFYFLKVCDTKNGISDFH